MSKYRLILASASPRRFELLRQVGLDPETVASGLGEDLLDGEPPEAAVQRLAEAKGRRVASMLQPSTDGNLVILAADTAVVAGNRVLGKPRGGGQAREMLRLLSGRTHEVMTGVHLLRPEGRQAAIALERTRVRFRPLDRETIDWYLSTGEPMDKAGAYGIQGRGVLLTESIEGSWSNVVGLPLERLPGLFRRIGLAFPAVG